MGIISLKCPECGGDLKFDDSQEQGICQYCGGKIALKEDHITNITNKVTNHNISNSKVTIVTDEKKDFDIKLFIPI